MPVLRIPVTSKYRSVIQIEGLWFQAHKSTPSFCMVSTDYLFLCDDPTLACPNFEGLLGPGDIHDCWVEISVATGCTHRFLVGYKPKPMADINYSLEKIFPGGHFYGEAVVMRAGERHAFTGVGRGERRALAERAVHRYLEAYHGRIEAAAIANTVPVPPTFVAA